MRATLMPFPPFKLRPAIAQLRHDVRVSVQRSINQLPILGQRNPDGALMVGELIDEWIGPDPTNGVEHEVPRHETATNLPAAAPPSFHRRARDLEAWRRARAEETRCLTRIERAIAERVSAAAQQPKRVQSDDLADQSRSLLAILRRGMARAS